MGDDPVPYYLADWLGKEQLNFSDYHSSVIYL